MEGPFRVGLRGGDLREAGGDGHVYERLSSLSWILALAFVFFVGLDVATHEDSGGWVVVAFDSLAVIILVILAALTGRRLLPVRWAHPLLAFAAATTASSVLVELSLYPTSAISNYVVLIVFGLAMTMLSLRWYAVTAGTIIAAWLVVALPTLSTLWIVHFVGSLTVVLVVSVSLLLGRIQAFESLQRLSDTEQHRRDELEGALETAQAEINQRLAVEEMLREREQLLHELINNIGSAVIVVDALDDGEDFVLEHANHAAYQTIWFRKDTTVGRRLSEVLPGTNESGLAEALRRVHRSGEAERFPRFLYRDDIREVELNLFLFRLASGSVVGLFEDRTERSEAEHERRRLTQQMQQMQRYESLGHLAHGVAHRFNNLVMSVLGNAEFLLEDLPEDSPSREDVNTIVASAMDASKLCSEMMACAGRSGDHMEPLNLSDVVGGLQQLLRVTVGKTAELDFALPEEIPDVAGDPGQVRQILVNLIANASEALEGGEGTVRVETFSIDADARTLRELHLDGQIGPGRYVGLRVSDDGSGMDDETRVRIFEPFFTTRFAGRGLGLAAVLGIVRRHRGAVTVDSEPDKGSAVCIYFPVLDEGDDSREMGFCPPRDCHGTALIAEPEFGDREVLRLVLEQRGCEVMETGGMEDLIRAAKALPGGPALIVLDSGLIGLRADEVLEQLRDAAPNAFLVLTSVFEEEEILSRFEAWNPDDYLRKPIRAADAHETVERLREHYRAA